MSSFAASAAIRPAVPAAGPILIPAIADDGSLYPVEKLEAHRRALPHLAVSVFVLDGEGRLLIQQRAANKYHCGGQWANTCCTHPHWGETDMAGVAARRLREELGIAVALRQARVVEYRAAVSPALTEHERVTMFVGRADAAALRVEPDPAEVSAVRWAGAEEIGRDIAARPEAYTPWFRIYLERFPTFSI